MDGWKAGVQMMLSLYLIAVVSRFKTYRKYLYTYSTESRNGVVGTANLRNGPKVTCKVEIKVPQACSFIMHTTDCAVSEVSVMDPQGQPHLLKLFKICRVIAVFRNPLKFTVENAVNVELFSAQDEPVNILNIKRGIVSALLSPDTKESRSVMVCLYTLWKNNNSTVHGLCQTAHQVNADDVSVTRDLSQCDQFYGRELTKIQCFLFFQRHPMSKLITSNQECNYQFDNKGKHITAVLCTEKHVFLPFSGNGMSSVITQELNFQNSKRINNRDFGESCCVVLWFTSSPVQTKDAAVNILSELLALAGTDQGQKRTSLFHKLVSTMRALRNETLSETVTAMLDMSTWVTWQALFQCGTSECMSAMLQSIWKIDGLSSEVIGVMGQPMQDYGPSLASAVLRCAKRTDAPLLTQKAAIQAFRNIYINDEVCTKLSDISPVEKRVASYLVLMNNMDEATAKAIVDTVDDVTDEELKTFVVTHLNNMDKRGEGFEPAFKALWGEKGFVPDSFFKLLQKQVLNIFILHERDSVAYLEYLGSEIGYMKSAKSETSWTLCRRTSTSWSQRRPDFLPQHGNNIFFHSWFILNI
uniref:Vitellogenin domain-containing protein n=1 Tax=Neogobius melanostomus TaxID=47308 RepID=A0A8C6UPJ7_9GOBI